MKKLLLISSVLFISFSSHARTGFGLGAILGDPTGISAKYFMENKHSLDGGLSYNSHELTVWSDYLHHFHGKLGNQNAFVSALSPFVGVGPVLAFGDKDESHHLIPDDDDTFAFGARIPLGIEWMAKEVPLGVSLEVVPGILAIPETDAFFQAGLALRYYF